MTASRFQRYILLAAALNSLVKLTPPPGFGPFAPAEDEPDAATGGDGLEGTAGAGFEVDCAGAMELEGRGVLLGGLTDCGGGWDGRGDTGRARLVVGLGLAELEADDTRSPLCFAFNVSRRPG